LKLHKKMVSEVKEIHFADTPQLQSYISTSWSNFGPKRLITHEDIAAFGALTQNQQWIHDDATRCEQEGPYGAIIAHGLYILTLIPSLLPEESFRVVGHMQRIVRGCNHFRFPAPAYPGEHVHARVKLTNVQKAVSGKGVILTREVEVSAARRQTPVAVATFLLQYF